MHIDTNLKNKILETGLKQLVVADKAGIHPTRLSKIIYGHVKATEAEMNRLTVVLQQLAQMDERVLFKNSSEGE